MPKTLVNEGPCVASPPSPQFSTLVLVAAAVNPLRAASSSSNWHPLVSESVCSQFGFKSSCLGAILVIRGPI